MNECADELSHRFTYVVVYEYLTMFTRILPIIFLGSFDNADRRDVLLWLTKCVNTIVKTEHSKDSSLFTCKGHNG